jgi:RHS repeat-associated protein
MDEGHAVAVVEGGQIYFIRTDHIGRPVFATNDLGVKVWEASYLPLGGVHVATGGIDLRFPLSCILQMHCRAAGQWFQAESGLHQNWMRDYDPTTGRYIQADPLGLAGGNSLYGYALQNPSRFIDPTGENPLAVPIAVCEVFPAACAKVAEICIAGAIVATGYIANELWGQPDPLVSTPDEGFCDQCDASAPKGIIVNTPTGPIETFTSQPPPPPLPPPPPPPNPWWIEVILLLTGGHDI